MPDRWSKFLNSFPAPTWSDLLLGIERGYIVPNNVILWAGDYLLQHQNEETKSLLELATASPSDVETVRASLQELAQGESNATHERAVRRWRYLFLLQTRGYALGLPEAVERVYADFDYLPDMAHLIYYMPAPPGTPPLSEDFEVVLRRELEQFLGKELHLLNEVL